MVEAGISDGRRVEDLAHLDGSFFTLWWSQLLCMCGQCRLEHAGFDTILLDRQSVRSRQRLSIACAMLSLLELPHNKASDLYTHCWHVWKQHARIRQLRPDSNQPQYRQTLVSNAQTGQTTQLPMSMTARLREATISRFVLTLQNNSRHGDSRMVIVS